MNILGEASLKRCPHGGLEVESDFNRVPYRSSLGTEMVSLVSHSLHRV